MRKYCLLLLIIIGLPTVLPARLHDRADSLLTEKHIKAIYMAWPDSALRLTDMAEARKRLFPAQADMLRAMVYESQSMFLLEEQYLRRALQDKALRQNPKQYLSAFYQLALTLQNLDKHEESIRMAGEGIVEARRQGNLRVEAQLLFGIGQAYRALKRTGDAEDYMGRAVGLLEDSDDVHALSALSTFYGEWAAMYYDNDRIDEAIALCQKRKEVIDRMADMPGPPPGYIDQQYGYLYTKLATFYHCAGRVREAEESFRRYAATRFAGTPGGYAYVIPYLLEAHRYNDILPRLRRFDQILLEGDTISRGWQVQLDHYARTYRGLGNYRLADSYQQRTAALADSLYAREKASQAHEYATLFHTREQETQLRESREQNRNQRIFIGISLLAAALLGMLVWQKQRNVHRLDEMNRQAAKQIDELMAREKELRHAYAALAEAIPLSPDEEEDKDMEKVLLRAKKAENRLQELQLFLDPDLRREDLQKTLYISRATLSVLIRESGEDTYNNYINRLRVSHSVKLMQENALFSVDAIAKQSGFKSRSTFYAAFQRRFGMSPTQYKKTLTPQEQKEAEEEEEEKNDDQPRTTT